MKFLQEQASDDGLRWKRWKTDDRNSQRCSPFFCSSFLLNSFNLKIFNHAQMYKTRTPDGFFQDFNTCCITSLFSTSVILPFNLQRDAYRIYYIAIHSWVVRLLDKTNNGNVFILTNKTYWCVSLSYISRVNIHNCFAPLYFPALGRKTSD